MIQFFKSIYEYRVLLVILGLIVASCWSSYDDQQCHHRYIYKNKLHGWEQYDKDGNIVAEWRNGKLVKYKNMWVRLFTWDWEFVPVNK